MMGRFVRGMLLGLLFVCAVGVWPAGATIDTNNTTVTAPADNSVLRGRYDDDGTPVAFEHTIRARAATTGGNCDDGFSSIKIWITGPSYNETVLQTSTTTGTSWSGGPSSPWDTQTLRNGVYSVRLSVTERDAGSGLLTCNGSNGPQTYPMAIDVKVANQPATPEWSGSPTAAGDGSAVVVLRWAKNAEDDIISYEITRTGPDGTITGIIPTSVCSGSTCQVQDGPGSFPAEYSGSYAYKITAVRSAPSGTGEECGNARCVKSNSSDVRSVTLTKPTPTPAPSPSGSPTSSPKPSPGGGGNTGGGSSSTGTNRGSTRVLSFGGSGGSSYNDFYSGTYDENLPYQPKSLVIGNGKTSAPSARNEAAAFSEDPPNYRTIMLPVAGGLLAFLSAAHVRRLLIHF